MLFICTSCLYRLFNSKLSFIIKSFSNRNRYYLIKLINQLKFLCLFSKSLIYKANHMKKY